MMTVERIEPRVLRQRFREQIKKNDIGLNDLSHSSHFLSLIIRLRSELCSDNSSLDHSSRTTRETAMLAPTSPSQLECKKNTRSEKIGDIYLTKDDLLLSACISLILTIV